LVESGRFAWGRSGKGFVLEQMEGIGIEGVGMRSGRGI
jgi:hypothetical protein